jgi:alanine racemase
MALFDRLIDDLARDGLRIPVTQVRASNGILDQLKDHCTAVSPGALLYGMTGEAAGATPVMRAIRSRLIHITSSSADRGPAYDTRFAAKATGPTGVVPFGRVDGNRMPVAGSGAHMLVGGRKAPILSVSLEHAVIDLSAVPDAAPGTEVVILGRSGAARISL